MAELLNFDFLPQSTRETWLKDHAGGSVVIQDGKAKLLFVKDTLDADILDYELERLARVNGEGTFRIPDTLEQAVAKTPNPWARDTLNLTQQGKMLKDNPELARRLMAKAGVKAAL
ncbi:MAG: hypothetical protein PHT19_10390 [Methylococcus sp.]|nr:hypothetical protein [Methylococcus sp.]